MQNSIWYNTIKMNFTLQKKIASSISKESTDSVTSKHCYIPNKTHKKSDMKIIDKHFPELA